MKVKNGIILAGGNGTRLQPHTFAINKSLLNINGKAVIDYPLNTLKQMGVENVSVILGGEHHNQVVNYLQDGKRYGLKFNFLFQKEANGISAAISLCERFVADEEHFAVCLGDNIYSEPVVWQDVPGAQVVLYNHPELKRFGVASIDPDSNKIVKIEEKPKELDDRYFSRAITGCYLFDQRFFDFFAQTKPSQRSEFEITDIIDTYNKVNCLNYTFAKGLWADAGNYQAIDEISQALR